jgi:RecB family exonuclease
MPNCYSLTRKDFVGPCPRPESLASVDDRLCAYFGVAPHPKYFYENWENNIGLLLSLGKTWDEVREICLAAENGEFGKSLATIATWLEQHYDVAAWAEIGRR